LATFAPLVGHAFAITATDDTRVDAILIEAVSVSDQPVASGRVPFSIIFSGPGDPILPQGIHRLEHETLGPLDVFLVPLQPEAGEARYQAVFA
jgi:hypothetical protein